MVLYQLQLNVVNPDAATETNTYDINGNLLISETSAGIESYTYNTKNQLISTTAANGEKTDYTVQNQKEFINQLFGLVV